MSCNLGKTRARFTVNSRVFVILFWFLVEHFKLSARKKVARDTRDAFLESVYPCIEKFEVSNLADKADYQNQTEKLLQIMYVFRIFVFFTLLVEHIK